MSSTESVPKPSVLKLAEPPSMFGRALPTRFLLILMPPVLPAPPPPPLSFLGSSTSVAKPLPWSLLCEMRIPRREVSGKQREALCRNRAWMRLQRISQVGAARPGSSVTDGGALLLWGPFPSKSAPGLWWSAPYGVRCLRHPVGLAGTAPCEPGSLPPLGLDTETVLGAE